MGSDKNNEAVSGAMKVALWSACVLMAVLFACVFNECGIWPLSHRCYVAFLAIGCMSFIVFAIGLIKDYCDRRSESGINER
ncbi:MAG: hypothetical protein P4L67_01570 [Candidatus Pacebacteria bacterium]|nr:hypothetical protein [Candidatus Paceibacterota bacterium]